MVDNILQNTNGSKPVKTTTQQDDDESLFIRSIIWNTNEFIVEDAD